MNKLFQMKKNTYNFDKINKRLLMNNSEIFKT